MGEDLQIRVAERLEPQEVHAIALLVERIAEAEGVRPLGEHVVVHLLDPDGTGQLHICAWRLETLVGYAHADLDDPAQDPVAEMAIDFLAGFEVGEAMLTQLINSVGRGVQLWTHGSHSKVRELASSYGFVVQRELIKMRRKLGGNLPKAALADGISIRPFDYGRDADEWLALNSRAFAGLPDQGGWGPSELALRVNQTWFDPNGFLLAHTVDESGNEGPLIGFHWTKVHPATASGPALGEVFVLAVDPAVQARGLGRALTILGLAHLRDQGLAEVILYVDAANAAAIRTYESLGFRPFETDTLLLLPTDAVSGAAHGDVSTPGCGPDLAVC